MKKFILLTAAIVFMCSTAYGAAIDAAGDWDLTTPTQVKTVANMVQTIMESHQIVHIDFNAGGANYAQTSQPSDLQLGTDGLYHPVVTTPPYSGTWVDNGDGSYLFDPNATSGWFVGSTGSGKGFATEITTHQVTYTDATDRFTDGIMATNVDISALFGLMPGTVVSVVNLDYFGDRVGGAPVPIPGAFVLLCSGLLGLFGIRRRFNR